MLIKLSGGTVYDPANGVSGEVRDIYVEDGRIVAAPPPETRIDKTHDLKGRVVMAGAIDPHTHIGGGKMTIARMLLPEDHIKDEVARTDLTRAGTGHAVPSTHRHRLPLCRDGLHRLLRAGDAAGQCAPGAYGDGRYADGRQRRLRHARQRRFLPAPARGQGGFRGHQGLRRLDHARLTGDRGQGGESRRHQRLQVQSAQARSRRGAQLLPRDAAPDHLDAGARGARSSASPIPCTFTAAISACPAMWRRRSTPSAPRKVSPSISPTSSSTPTAPRATGTSPPARRASPRPSTRPRTSPSMSARSCSARPAPRQATACANTRSRGARIRRSRW